jgi:hypothetical protein
MVLFEVSKLAEACKAAVLLLVAMIVVALFAQMLRAGFRGPLRDSYAHSFSWTPGSHFGASIAALRDPAQPRCAVLGNSAAREAIDPYIMGSSGKDRAIVNAATTGGNNLVFELQAHLLKSHGARPACVILAMNSWNMFSNGRPQLVADDYLALLDWNDLMSLSYQPFLSREAPRLLAGMALPLKPQGKQLNRLVREKIWEWRAISGDPVPKARYSYFAGELEPAVSFQYSGPPILQDKWAELSARNAEYYDPARYGGTEERASFDAMMRTLLTLTRDVYVVVLPQSPILERASRVADPTFQAALEPYRRAVRLVDCSSLNSVPMLYDEGHLTANGRAALSASLAKAIADGSARCSQKAWVQPGP